MGSRVRIVCALSAAVLAVTGCVSMPSSGPPNSLRVKAADGGQNQDYTNSYPQPPQPGWDAKQVVEGFLTASSSWYTAGDIVKQYLTPQAQRSWNPGSSVTVFGSFDVTGPSGSGQQATISVDGPVRAALNNSGQQLYSSAQGSSPDAQPSSGATSCSSSVQQCTYSFTLAKVGGQWRIAALPPALLLNETSFDRTWEPQDVYFFDSGKRVLVPDKVFVPKGTSETDLLDRLANALKNGPPSWLSGATVNLFSQHVTSVSVSVLQPTAVVSLKGTLSATDPALQDIAAELVWTLAAASASSAPITGVQLVVNGTQWSTPVNQGSAYDPYPSEAASFTFVDKNGVPQSLCGSTKNSPVGVPVPIFSHSGGGTVATCNPGPAASSPPFSSPSPTTSASTTATQQPNSHKPGHTGRPAGKPPVSKTPAGTGFMAAVSPDGKYIAEVSSDGNQLSMGSLTGKAAVQPVSGPDSDITSISWDRQHDLWLTQGGTVWMVPQGGKPYLFPLDYQVTSLAVAPDGVRMAMIVSGASGTHIQLASINPNGSQVGQPTPHGNEAATPTISSPQDQVPLGPDITNATALTWYDADNLIVLSGGSDELQVVSVDGRASTQNLAPPPTQQGATVSSIAAGNGSNVVVAGLSNGQLEVSAGFEGPWQLVPVSGYAPIYVIPSAPTSS
jgi:hypothetical protein